MTQADFRRDFIKNADARKSRTVIALDVQGWEKVGRLEKIFSSLAAVKLHPEHARLWGKSDSDVLAHFHKLGLPVLLDAKLADIDKSNEMKARFYFSLGYDAIICHGFEGESAVAAVLRIADEMKKGVFLLVSMTSPGNLFSSTTADSLVEMAKKLNVAGVIAPGNNYRLLKKVKAAAGELIILSPGIGAQGGEAEKAARAGADFAIVGRSIINSPLPDKELAALNRIMIGGSG